MKSNLDLEIQKYHQDLTDGERVICDLLAEQLLAGIPEATFKLWHGHPVWFLNDNPIVGYSKQKPGIRLMFWSGADFEEPGLNILGKKFKDASIFYSDIGQVDMPLLQRWIEKSKHIQWDYKNLIKRKGKLERLLS
jgi:hypothetical protein